MIQAKIMFFEQELKKSPLKNADKLEVVSGLKELLNQIDFKAEVVPITNVSKVSSLFKSLKNAPLTEKEKLIIKQFVKS